MIRNYLKIAFRNLKRNAVFSSINIVGLALGISTFLFILEYVGLEKGINQFHKNIENIYRVTNVNKDGDRWIEIAPGWAPIMKEKIPGIDQYCRIADGVTSGIVQNQAANISFREESIAYVESNFFNFFSFPLLQGSPTDFDQPYTAFISQSAAKKYFKDADPVNKELKLNNQFGNVNYLVKGVFQDMGSNSDFQFDILFNLETLQNPANLNGNSWARLDNLDSQFLTTYFSIFPKTDAQEIEKKLMDLNLAYNKEDDRVQFNIQALKNAHLGSSLQDELPTTGKLRYVYILVAIAFLILVIAWLNYINLSTATSLKRSPEIGIKKAIGAMRFQLLQQFLTETLLLNLLAFSLAGVLVIVGQKYFNQLIGQDISFADLNQSKLWLIGLASILMGSLFSGLYTAYLISGFDLINSLKGTLTRGKKQNTVHQGLVIFQFSISVALILATVIIYRQLRYMQTKDLGFDKQLIMTINGPNVGNDSTFNSRNEGFKNFLGRQAFVQRYGTSGSIPGKFYSFKTSGFTQPNSKPDDKYSSYAFLIIGEGFLPTYEIPVLEGRNFTKAECQVNWNDNSKVLINEKALKAMRFDSAEEALLKGIQWDERHLDIIGVVADYHHSSLHNPIEPMIFYPQNSSAYYSVKLTSQDLSKKISGIETAFKSAFPGNPFDYTFTDESFAQAYAEETRFGQIFTTASFLAIFIACLGLFGLATYTVQLRTKEIGLRKVLGAGVFSVVNLLSKDFLKLVLIAIVIGCPVAWYGMSEWLQNFSFKVTLEWWLVLIAAACVVLIALLTVGYQSLKASLSNPVEALKNN